MSTSWRWNGRDWDAWWVDDERHEFEPEPTDDVIGDALPPCTCADPHLVDLYHVESRDAVARLCTRCGRSQA